WILPNAPSNPVTLNGGMRMPSWYDIYTLDGGESRKHDESGLLESVSLVQKLVDQEVSAGIPADRVFKDQSSHPRTQIVVGGFSQGGAVALLFTALTKSRLAGSIGLSTYLPMHTKIPELTTGTNKDTPVFMGHGDADQVVQFSWGKSSHEHLKTLGYSNTEFHQYAGMAHSSCNDEIRDLAQFLKKISF
ncbi:MAG: hypothetical protein SGCHY_005100, partial [Lobulomycetales sp.]